MIRLFIDNHEADVDSSSEISISLSMASLTSTSWGHASYSKSITIPATPLNRRLMGDCEQPLAAQMFNHSLHTGRVEVDGCVIIEGTIYLTASRLGPEGYYRFNIVGNAREWIKTALEGISSLLPESSFSYDEESIRNGLLEEGESLVRFFPVERRGVAVSAVRHNRLLPEDYHPFVNIGLLLRAIFAKAGYAVESEFMDSEFFRSLYMSGRWSEQDFQGWVDDMDFYALLTSSSVVAEADEFGRVYADPLANGSTVGNLVSLPDGTYGSYNRGCLGEDSSGRLVFTPPYPVNVAFEHRLRFNTGYQIRDRHTLEGLTTIRPDYGDQVTVPIANSFVDHREEALDYNHLYTLIIFDVVEGALYNLYGREITNPNANPANLSPDDYTEQRLISTTFRESSFTNTYTNAVQGLRLEMIVDGVASSPASDWALYDGHVHEFGSRVMDVTLRTKAQEVTPSSPKTFDMFRFSGPRQPLDLQLLSGCSMRPIFVPHPIEGATLRWSEIMDYSFTGLELLTALKELFDLQIYTDPLDRKVCIEPRSEWCDPRVVVDLSDRVDITKGVIVEEMGGGHPERLTLAYRRGDKAVEMLTLQTGEEYGVWSAEVENIFATEGEKRVENGLFAASLSTSGTLSASPSASLILTGDSGGPGTARLDYHNFLPKIVSYRGLKTLPDGQELEYPAGLEGYYPLLTFYDDGTLGGEPRSLLFCDKEGVVGLGHHWQPRVETLNRSRRITLYLTLYASEVEQIVVPNSTKHDFRAHYLVEIEGEKVLCRLEEIVDYNPASPSTKVIMVTV